MIDWIIVLFIWAALILSFLAGCAFNANAYDRGYRDGVRETWRRFTR